MFPHLAQVATRGPVTAISMLVALASLSGGAFFVALRNVALDCAEGSATGVACTVDVLESIVTGILAVGAAAAATTIALTSPTPRSNLVFRVDGVDVPANHTYGLNRTEAHPAVVEWQHNSTSKISKYTTYFKDGQLYMRHHTGIRITDPLSTGLGKKRSTCEAYYDFVLYGDSLRSWEDKYPLSAVKERDVALAMFNFMVYQRRQDACFYWQANAGGWQTKFRFGASCSQTSPAPTDCWTQDYNWNLLEFTGA